MGEYAGLVGEYAAAPPTAGDVGDKYGLVGEYSIIPPPGDGPVSPYGLFAPPCVGEYADEPDGLHPPEPGDAVGVKLGVSAAYAGDVPMSPIIYAGDIPGAGENKYDGDMAEGAGENAGVAPAAGVHWVGENMAAPVPAPPYTDSARGENASGDAMRGV